MVWLLNWVLLIWRVDALFVLGACFTLVSTGLGLGVAEAILGHIS